MVTWVAQSENDEWGLELLKFHLGNTANQSIWDSPRHGKSQTKYQFHYVIFSQIAFDHNQADSSKNEGCVDEILEGFGEIFGEFLAWLGNYWVDLDWIEGQLLNPDAKMP